GRDPELALEPHPVRRRVPPDRRAARGDRERRIVVVVVDQVRVVVGDTGRPAERHREIVAARRPEVRRPALLAVRRRPEARAPRAAGPPSTDPDAVRGVGLDLEPDADQGSAGTAAAAATRLQDESATEPATCAAATAAAHLEPHTLVV